MGYGLSTCVAVLAFFIQLVVTFFWMAEDEFSPGEVYND